MKRFSAVIYKIGINPVVDPPDEVIAAVLKSAGRSKGPVPVCGKINGAEFVQTLIRYGGAWRLYVNGKMLSDSGLNVLDTAEIEIAFDPLPRDVPVPPAFEQALAEDMSARTAFGLLAPSRQKEILRYLGGLKTEVSVMRNIERLLRQLRGDAPD